MCNYRILNLGLPAAQLDSFDLHEGANDPIEVEHRVFSAFGLTAFSDFVQRALIYISTAGQLPTQWA